MNKVIVARNYALDKHCYQTYGIHDYIYHLDMVHSIIVEMNLGVNYEVAAYLHDILEDTETEKEDLKKLFGQDIVDIVFAVSGSGETRKIRNNDIIEKLLKYPQAINLKMADRLANIISAKESNIKLFNMYKKEQIIFNEVFELGSKELLNRINKELDISCSKLLKI
jgi:(p)ppGpp synthase/HD superfamily hydrolase